MTGYKLLSALSIFFATPIGVPVATNAGLAFLAAARQVLSTDERLSLTSCLCALACAGVHFWTKLEGRGFCSAEGRGFFFRGLATLPSLLISCVRFRDTDIEAEEAVEDEEDTDDFEERFRTSARST